MILRAERVGGRACGRVREFWSAMPRAELESAVAAESWMKCGERWSLQKTCDAVNAVECPDVNIHWL